MPDGGVVVYGNAGSSADFGDLTFGSGAFVASFDRTGATQWAFSVQDLDVLRGIAVSRTGDILIGSQIGERSLSVSSRVDTYVSIATPAGVFRTVKLDGAGAQLFATLAAASDGTAWVQVRNARSEFPVSDPDPAMQIGDQTFTDEGTYLLKIVL